MRFLPLLLGALAAAAPAAAQHADSAHVLSVAEVEVPPRVRNAEEFAAALRWAYPPQLRQVGGTVQLSFVVGADGATGEVRVLGATDSAFIAPAVQALSMLRFTPAQMGGRPVAVRVEQPITWAVDPAALAAADGAALADSGTTVYALAAVDEVPRPIDTRAFQRALARDYPRALRDAGRSGQVTVRYVVEVDGRVTHARVVRSSDPGFEKPSLDAIRTLRFRPALLNGRPVRVWVDAPINWTMVPGGD